MSNQTERMAPEQINLEAARLELQDGDIVHGFLVVDD